MRINSIDNNVSSLKTLSAAIKAKTDNLPSDPADASDIASLIGGLDTLLDSIKAKTDNLPSDPADASDIASLIGGLDTLLDGIKAKTDLLSSDGFSEVAVKKTTIADGTTIPNNTQGAAGLLAVATDGAIMIEEITWQRGATSFSGPTNYEISTNNTNGLTGAANPVGVAIAAKFAAANTGILSLDGTTKQLPFVLESSKSLFIHGDDGVTAAGGTTDFYIKYRKLAVGAYLA